MSATRMATVPPERLFWGRIPAAKAGGDATARRYAFERLLPRPVDGLQVAECRLDDGSVLMAGLPVEQLSALMRDREDIGPRTWALVPAAIPACLPAMPAVDLQALNLLHGAFEPRGRIRLRRAIGGLAALLLVTLAALLTHGITRRVERWRTAAARARQERDHLIATALEATGQATVAPTLPPSQQLILALRRLEQTGSDTGVSGADGTFNAEPVLEQLWRRWPRNQRLQVETVAVNEHRLTIRGAAADAVAAEVLAKTLGSFTAAGRTWHTHDPDIHAAADGCRFVISYRALAPKEDRR